MAVSKIGERGTLLKTYLWLYQIHSKKEVGEERYKLSWAYANLLYWSMERESYLAVHEAMRAVRSLAWNRKVLPLIEGRIERAEQTLKSYLTLENQTTARLGVYQVDLEAEEINLTRLPTDEWQQLVLLDPTDQELRQSGDIFVASSSPPLPQNNSEASY